MDNEATYWKDVACWMADVIAATASHQIGLSRCGAGEKSRQKNIAAMAADALEGRNHPTSRKPEVVIERLRALASATEPRL